MLKHSLISNLRQLQLAQYHHDQTAHQDILGLAVPRRITHFILHFSKYLGLLAKSSRKKHGQLPQRVIADSLIIALAAANAMNVDLQNRLSGYASDNPISIKSSDDTDLILSYYAELVGEMAKACEALDHLENFPSREVLERNIVFLVPVIGHLADIVGGDLITDVKNRWKEIEQKPSVCMEGKNQPKLSTVANRA